MSSNRNIFRIEYCLEIYQTNLELILQEATSSTTTTTATATTKGKTKIRIIHEKEIFCFNTFFEFSYFCKK